MCFFVVSLVRIQLFFGWFFSLQEPPAAGDLRLRIREVDENGLVVSNNFYLYPYMENDPFLTDIFQMG